jgi:2-polyprenyl-3-methyl-5-hydroxy-6-metoxy-1,4-benzoquinol methylase
VQLYQNDKRAFKCPLCYSEEIVKSPGYVKYIKPVIYGTIALELTQVSELWHCKKCTSHFIQNILDEKTTIQLYTNSDSQKRWADGASFDVEKTDELLQKLEEFFKKDVSVLDIGCSTGSLLDFAASKGCKTYGLEYSESAKAIAALKGHQMLKDLSSINLKFDIITAFDLIEHVYEPLSFFQQCNNLLSDNGYLIILTGNPQSFSAKLLGSKWWYYRFPEHVIFPSQLFYRKFIKSFELVDVLLTYNAKSYHALLKKRLFQLIFYLKRDKFYSGLPSLSPDHHLIVLKKRNH